MRIMAPTTKGPIATGCGAFSVLGYKFLIFMDSFSKKRGYRCLLNHCCYLRSETYFFTKNIFL
jgi:hypothetical protein